MNNSNNCGDINNINSQLERASIQKNILFRSLNREYEFYLKLVRDLLYISVEEGLNELCSDQSFESSFLNKNELFSSFEIKISKLIDSKLPLITFEQLKINKIENNFNKEINLKNLKSSAKTKEVQKEEFQYQDGFQLEKLMQFNISEDISSAPQYYKAENREKFVSIDLDKNHHTNNISNKHIIENIGVDKQFVSSLLELIEEVKVEKSIYFDDINIGQMDISPKHNNFRIFDFIDKSLENLLLDLSYKINLELFKANLIKKIISQDSFEYLVGNKLMIKHPYPFIINFEFNINQSSSNGENIPSIIFFNISTVELEFKNLNLSIQRNKINELKEKFLRLIKKERYWRQKEITLNKIR